MTNSKGRQFPPEKVGPKLRRYALGKAWDEMITEDRARKIVKQEIAASGLTTTEFFARWKAK